MNNCINNCKKWLNTWLSTAKITAAKAQQHFSIVAQHFVTNGELAVAAKRKGTDEAAP